MKLDRNINQDRRGKYAVVNLRRTTQTLGELSALLNHHGEIGVLDFGNTPDTGGTSESTPTGLNEPQTTIP